MKKVILKKKITGASEARRGTKKDWYTICMSNRRRRRREVH
jgi:hypothetical protein